MLRDMKVVYCRLLQYVPPALSLRVFMNKAPPVLLKHNPTDSRYREETPTFGGLTNPWTNPISILLHSNSSPMRSTSIIALLVVGLAAGQSSPDDKRVRGRTVHTAA